MDKNEEETIMAEMDKERLLELLDDEIDFAWHIRVDAHFILGLQQARKVIEDEASTSNHN